MRTKSCLQHIWSSHLLVLMLSCHWKRDRVNRSFWHVFSLINFRCLFNWKIINKFRYQMKRNKWAQLLIFIHIESSIDLVLPYLVLFTFNLSQVFMYNSLNSATNFQHRYPWNHQMQWTCQNTQNVTSIWPDRLKKRPNEIFFPLNSYVYIKGKFP